MSHRGPVRQGLANMGTALIGACVLEWFCVQAFAIPSPSMQPTLLGCAEAGVFDRVLVDRLRYVVHEPERWDLAVFRFPLQQREAYLKRLVGLPGEQLRIVGGNLYRLQRDEGHEVLEVLRKPEHVQRSLWREVFPARRVVRGERGLSGSFRAEPAGAFTERGEGLNVVLPDGVPVQLTFADTDGGLVDRIWDGHPLAVARALRNEYVDRALLGEIVPDARIAVRLEAATLTRCTLALTIVRPRLPARRYACELAGGRGTLAVHGDGDELLAASTPFACSLGDGAELAFAHLDDELVCWRDGVELARLDTSAWSCRDGCELPDPCGLGPALPTAEQSATASLELAGRGQLTLRDLHIWRDQHFTRGPLPADHVIAVPAGHYFLLGDNPRQSNDGRSWRALQLGIAPDGSLLPAGVPGATVVRGNLEPAPAEAWPARDENPMAIPSLGLLLMQDEHGEVHSLRCDRQFAMENGQPVLRIAFDASTPPYPLLTDRAPFVPRQALLGRAMLTFWPLPPFGPWRLHWLR